MISRRAFLKAASAASPLLAAGQPALGQQYPTKPIKIILGFPTGGLSDIIARIIAEKFGSHLGQRVIVESRPGAATNVATEVVVRSPADGYTLLLATALNAINTSTYPGLSFKFADDLEPVVAIADAAFVLEVHPSVPVRDVRELIAYAKAHPGRLTMASGGTGGPEHVAGELFKSMAEVDLLHVPYRGSGPAINDLIGGHVLVYFGPIAPSIEHIKSGLLTPLAVTTTDRSDALPGVPAISEFLPGYAVSAWQGLAAPKGTPADAVKTLNRACNAALSDPVVRARFVELGATPLGGTREAFSRLIAADTEKWARLVKLAGIKAD